MDDLEMIDGVGPKTKELLNKLQIYNKEDLLNHYPFRYEVIKRSNLQEIRDGNKIIIDGLIVGQPTMIYLSPKLKKIILRINTDKNIFNIAIYNKVYLMDELKSGKYITVIGKYNKIKNTIIASDIRLEKLPPVPVIESIYYTTNGLSRKNISKYITSVLGDNYQVKEYLPTYIIDKWGLLSKKEALNEIHNPKEITLLKRARQRLKYEELFLYLLKINILKDKKLNNKKAIVRKIDYDKIEKLIKTLSFELTEDQKTSLYEILSDMAMEHQMNRLLQGDVGSGKTIVALLSAYANYLANYQTALMVPTEILARQHYHEAIDLFKDLNLKIELLTSNTTKKEKKRIYEDLSSGKSDLVIGTQSLIQKDVSFHNLGLIITDEQHRFGVNQRTMFKNKGEAPDVLSMSATPIPRTYALTIYGDMDISNIKTKPIGRKEIITYYKREKDITSVLEMMMRELELHHQIYVIAPTIDGDNELEENVLSLQEKMNKAFGKKWKIAAIHGKLEGSIKNDIMKSYEEGKIDILISTTVVEVGVNVPNATMIVIFDANLFGLSTIHQLRGRVGRGESQSYCILISKDFHERLKMLEKCHDGFEISEYDFKNRGEGDIFGIRQSGLVGLKLADIKKDYQMLLKARDDVINFLPEFIKHKDRYPDLVQEINKVFELD